MTSRKPCLLVAACLALSLSAQASALDSPRAADDKEPAKITFVEDLVYVDPLHHQEGLGRELLAKLVDAARDLGYKTIVASLAADNRAGLRLHEKAGFEIVGTLKDAAYKFERWMDITLVQRSLE